MAKLELNITGYNDTLNSMLINSKKQKLGGLNQGIRKCYFEGDKAEIVIFKTHQYIGKFWWLWSIFFYLISIFGIFDSYYNKRCLVVDFRFNVNLDKDKTINLKIQNFEDGGKYAEIESVEEFEEISNIQYFDKDAQKKHKKMKKIKFLLFVLIAIATVGIIILVN